MTTGKVYALIIPRFEDVFHSFYASEVIKGITVSAGQLKVNILIHMAERIRRPGWLKFEGIDPRQMGGIIFADMNGDKEQFMEFAHKEIPCIVMNNYFAESVNCVSIDNLNGAMEAVEYLVKLGHVKIATITGDSNTQAGELRLEGYRQIMTRYGFQIPAGYIQDGGFLKMPARRAIKNLLSLKDRPTAIFAASDVMALEAVEEARVQGLRIPWDFSLVGFDDNPIAAYSQVRLTTVFQPIAEMGRLALEKLVGIAQGSETPPVKIVLPTKLIKRESTLVLDKKSA
jgi:DNA-binding LacI/PurR family transcriptional regulator